MPEIILTLYTSGINSRDYTKKLIKGIIIEHCTVSNTLEECKKEDEELYDEKEKLRLHYYKITVEEINAQES